MATLTHDTPEGTVLPQADAQIDTSGLTCPLPLLRSKKALQSLASGQVLQVRTTDAMAKHDFQVFTQQTGHGLLAQVPQPDGAMLHFVQKR